MPPLERPVRDLIGDRVQLPRIYLAFRTESFGTAAWWAANLGANVLADGKSSPLVEDLVVRRELAQDVSAYLYPTEEVGVFVVVATARPGVDPARLEAQLHAHLGRLREDGGVGATDAPRWEIEPELDRARRRALAALHSDLQTVDHRADLLSQYTTYFDDPTRALEEARDLAAVTPGEIREFANERLRDEQCATLVVVPTPGSQ